MILALALAELRAIQPPPLTFNQGSQMSTLTYSEHEYRALEREVKSNREQLAAVESLRPHWAQGHTSDSMAAQASTNALQQIWDALGVYDQTAAMQRINQLQHIDSPE